MSDIKPEALAQWCSKNSAELTRKQLRDGVSFIMKVQAAGIKSNF